MGPRLGTMRPEYQHYNLIKDSIEVKDYLTWVTGKVSEYGHKTFNLENLSGARWKIGGLEDTIYKGNDGELKGWGKFYLPKPVNMKVVGVVEGTSCPCDQLVLMTCEDRKVYAFDGEKEELDMVAESLEKLLLDGLKYPSSERYPKRQPSKDMLQGACGEDEDPRPEPRSAGELSALIKESTKVKDYQEDYLTWVSGFVSEFGTKTFTLKKPAGATLQIGDLEDPYYNDEEFNEWGNFYLPEIVTMKVVGVVEGTSYPYDQLVLMTCEDRKLYAFDGEEEELHMVAESLEELSEEGLKYPSSQSYYKGEAFKDMKEKDWDEVRKSDVGKKLDEEHRKLVKENKPELLKYLQSITQNQSPPCSLT
ncbi:uncharacterized protein LOC120563445 [Perca fluviatilis]|nr:uncharacterized protein LOC120563445 [Perca fluviatilis]